MNAISFEKNCYEKMIGPYISITTKTHESKSNGIFPLSDRIILRLLQYHHQKTKWSAINNFFGCYEKDKIMGYHLNESTQQ